MRYASFLLVALCIWISGCASFQKTDPALMEKPFTYVYDVPNASKTQVYKKSLLWIANTYNSAESVITFQDEDAGTLKGRAIGSLMPRGDFFDREFSYNLSIDAKDNKVRIQFANIEEHKRLQGGTLVAGIDATYQVHYDSIKEYFESVALKFKTQVTSAQSDSW